MAILSSANIFTRDGPGGQKYTLFFVISIHDIILFRQKCQYENSSNSISSDPLFWAVRRLNFFHSYNSG